jgi:putative DNA methylase
MDNRDELGVEDGTPSFLLVKDAGDGGRASRSPEEINAIETSSRPPLHTTTSKVSPQTAFHRTRLPHYEAGETPQHICFRLFDSLPMAILKQCEEELHHLNDPNEQERERRHRFAAALDQGYGACWLGQPEIARIVVSALQHFADTRYWLHAWVVMPNHVHVLITPIGGNSLSGIVHSWKSYTAKQANALLQRSGAFWQADYFDRFIRNAEHGEKTIFYIHENPVKAGLCAVAGDWAWSSAFDSVNGGRDALPPLMKGERASCPPIEGFL